MKRKHCFTLGIIAFFGSNYFNAVKNKSSREFLRMAMIMKFHVSEVATLSKTCIHHYDFFNISTKMSKHYI